MLKSIPFANAATVVTAVFYIICVLLSSFTKEFIFLMGRSWMHTINLDAIKASDPISPGLMIFGLVTISAVTWITSWAFVELYNNFSKSK